MTPEGRVVAAIKKRVKELGGEVRKCQWVGHVGAPDLFIMLNGRHFWIEVKSDTGCLASHQGREILRMVESGCDVFVVYGMTEAMGILDAIGA